MAHKALGSQWVFGFRDQGLEFGLTLNLVGFLIP